MDECMIVGTCSRKAFRQTRVAKLLVWVAGSVGLALCFYSNVLGVVESRWFYQHQRDMQSCVLGRVIVDQRDGFAAYGGLTGLAIPDPTSSWYGADLCDFQYAAYEGGLQFSNFLPYKTQIGGQALMFGCLDALLPLSPSKKLVVFWMLTSVLSAVALMGMVWWFYRQSGVWAATAVWLSVMFSPWVIVFGRNLWWCLWAFYVPFLAVGWYLLSSRSREGHGIAVLLGYIAFVAVTLKCFINGFEYITTTLIMMTCPLIYHALAECWSGRRFLRMGLGLVVGTTAAIVLICLVLCFQIAAVEGSLLDGIRHLIVSLEKRSHGNPAAFDATLTAGLQSSVWSVLWSYLTGVAINLNQFIHARSWLIVRVLYIRYWELIAAFLAGSAYIIWSTRAGRAEATSQRSRALVWVMWYSILVCCLSNGIT